MRFGSAFDTLLFDGVRGFDNQFAVMPKGMYKRGKKWEAFRDENWGKTFIKADEWDDIAAMVAVTRKHPIANALLTNGQSQVVAYWEHPELHEKCKGIVDFLNERHGVVVDVKTTTDARPDEWSKKIANYNYHWQAFMYLSGCRQLDPRYTEFVWIVIEKIRPFGVRLFRTNPQMLYLAERQITDLIKLYQECVEKDDWPCYPEDIQSAELPYWYTKKFEDVLYD
jgi:exodeoxyribonuclease VIII